MRSMGRWGVGAALACVCVSGCQEDAEETVEPVVVVIEVANVSSPGAFTATDASTHDIGLSPGIWIQHDASFQLFAEGASLTRAELENLGELGDAEPLLNALDVRPLPDGVSAVGVFGGAPGAGYANLQIKPGEAKELTTYAVPGDRLTLVFMLGMSNDTVVATPPGGLELFDASGNIRSGELSAELGLYDLGTEVNEDLAIGQYQPARGGGIDDGEAEGGVVTKVGEGAAGYPDIGSALTLTLTPR